MAYHLRTPLRPALDAAWFDELEQAAYGLNEIYSVLGPSPTALQQLRNTFEAAGCTTNPSLRPVLADPNIYLLQRNRLRQLLHRIETEETHDAVRRAYSAHISEAFCHIDLLLSAHAQDDQLFGAANRSIYGAPAYDSFAAAYAWLYAFIAEQAAHPSVAIRQAALEAGRQLSATISSDTELLPDDELFSSVRALHHAPGGYFEALLEDCPTLEQTIVTAETGDAVLRQVLLNIGSDYQVLDSPDHLWGIMHKQQAIVRPADYALERSAFYGLVAHELGSHLLERSNGLRQPLRLLARGLDRYDHCNEGRAFLREQIGYDSPDGMTDGEEWQSHILLHVAIGLASGLHQSHRYTFVELYHLLLPGVRLWSLLRGLDRPAADAYARTYTWNILTRCLKGTAGSGGAYLKDTIYLDGNLRCWQAAAINPQVLLDGDNGKFDIARDDHRAILADLGILGSV